ncbi:MAG: hypothetical protein FIB08_00610 [Candidatus Methanoperedens sp.]|nr:hypothetical protein [Candidatus Methanoperedens sp.]
MIYINKLSKAEREVFEDRRNKYEYLRASQVDYHQAIFVSLLVSSILYALTEAVPELAEFVILKSSVILGSLIIKSMILLVLMILTSVALKPYRKAIVQTQKPVVMSPNTVGTLEGYRIIKGTDGTEYVVANVTDIIEDNPIEVQK